MSANLRELIGGADASRISAVVDQLRARLDEGVYLPRALGDLLRDCSSLETIALLKVLGVPAEAEELVMERRRAAGEAFLNATSEAERDAALLAGFPELRESSGDDELCIV